MKKFSVLDYGALAVWLLPAVYLVFIYGSLPQNVPMHYDINGNVNAYGSKGEFIGTLGFLMGISALVYLLLKYLPLIDPKKQVKYGESTFHKLAFGIVIFLTALNIAISYATIHKGIKIDKLIFPVVGLLFIFIGNMMNSLKPNYFAGIRTPWTLESEDNWRATHRLASKVWVIGGIILTVLMLFLPAEAATIVFICCVLVMAFIPLTFSYLYFRKHRLNQHS
jgi:uncharacterized membrane protein